MLIRVFATLKNKLNKKIYLSIAGSGPMHLTLTKLIKQLELEKYVKLLGTLERNNIAEFLLNLDIYVQSSIFNAKSSIRIIRKTPYSHT